MKPPWDRRRRALPRLPKGQVRVQVKVIEVGGNAASYRRSRSYTLRDKSFKDICELLELALGLNGRVGLTISSSTDTANPTSGSLTPEPPAE